jgi:hypothetical protein
MAGRPIPFIIETDDGAEGTCCFYNRRRLPKMGIFVK